VKSYKSLNKPVYEVTTNYNGVSKSFYLRKKKSLNTLNTLTNQWEFYTRLFTVQSGMDESNGNGKVQLHYFSYKGNYTFEKDDKVMNFLTSGQQAAAFSWQDKRTLIQIENMTGYNVKPRGVVSQFKHGGFVVFEKDGHGLVAAISDLEKMDWNSAKITCEELISCGYSDWYLPSLAELELIQNNLNRLGIGGFQERTSNWYWSGTEYKTGTANSIDFNNNMSLYNEKTSRMNVRAVRSF
jgi:hypothetical protein